MVSYGHGYHPSRTYETVTRVSNIVPSPERIEVRYTTSPERVVYANTNQDLIDNGYYVRSIPARDATNKSLIFNSDHSRTMNTSYHVDHFACWHCDSSLSGSRYILKDDHPYCLKCYGQLFSHTCEECKQLIGTESRDLSYKDKHWHEKCFFCSACHLALIDKPFGSKGDELFCADCYNHRFASRCDKCQQTFKPGNKKMEYRGQQFHEQCFNCAHCNDPIGTRSFIPRDNKAHCVGCYEELYGTKCQRCAKIIAQGGVTYKNQPFHRECFTCSGCHVSLAGLRFTSRDDHPYCSDCFGLKFAKKCYACKNPITVSVSSNATTCNVPNCPEHTIGIGGTKYISFEERHWHNDCFMCKGCHKSLVGSGFITDPVTNDILCPDCGHY